MSRTMRAGIWVAAIGTIILATQSFPGSVETVLGVLITLVVIWFAWKDWQFRVAAKQPPPPREQGNPPSG